MPKSKEFTDDDDALLAELGVEVETKTAPKRTAREERIIAGFEEIQRFVEENGRAPRHADDGDIFERIYAVRLDQICAQEDCRALVEEFDHKGLLTGRTIKGADVPDDLDDDALLAELGVEVEHSPLTQLKHVRSHGERKAAADIARRDKCEDFDRFKPLFEKVQTELDDGVREALRFETKSQIEQGKFFIIGGQKAYVAEKGETTLTDQGRTDARLRVIFDNGTQSEMLMRSLQRALNADEAGKRISEPVAGPLFANTSSNGDQASGTIYVLRSQSDLPLVRDNRELVHKIGVTNSNVRDRLASAHLHATFLMAKVEVVATFELFNISSKKLEKLIHRIFEPAQLDIEVIDRWGKPVVPKEWFLVPLFVIDEAVERIRAGDVDGLVYDPKAANLYTKP